MSKKLYRPAGPDSSYGVEVVTADNRIDELNYIDAGYCEVPIADEASHDEIAELREQYHAVAGKKAFNGWNADKLREKIAAATE